MPVHATLLAAVHVFLLRHDDTEVYMIERGPSIKGAGMWSVPAGRLDEGEPITAAAIRETAEEVGVHISPEALGTPLIMHRWSAGAQAGRIYAFFAVRSWQGQPYNREPDKHSDAGWHRLDELPATTVPHVAAALQGLLAGHTYAETGWSEA